MKSAKIIESSFIHWKEPEHPSWDKGRVFTANVPAEAIIEPGKNLITSKNAGEIYIVNNIVAKLHSVSTGSEEYGYTCEFKALSPTINQLSHEIHQDNVAAGWWTDLETGLKKDRNIGELLCLVHSEISEAMEGARKGLPDDKLPHRAMFEVELADALIRIFDIAGAYKLDLEGAIAEKRAYNAKRADHKIENRKADGGKKF